MCGDLVLLVVEIKEDLPNIHFFVPLCTFFFFIQNVSLFFVSIFKCTMSISALTRLSHSEQNFTAKIFFLNRCSSCK